MRAFPVLLCAAVLATPANAAEPGYYRQPAVHGDTVVFVAEGDLCRVCRDPGRDATVICVVEESKDQAAIEKAGVVKGRYHILGGAISPLDERTYQLARSSGRLR